MNTKVEIRLNQFDKIKKFLTEVTKFSSDIDLIRDRYVIDAKSSIGIFTIDLSVPVTVQIHSDNDKEIEAFLITMEQFKKV